MRAWITRARWSGDEVAALFNGRTTLRHARWRGARHGEASEMQSCSQRCTRGHEEGDSAVRSLEGLEMTSACAMLLHVEGSIEVMERMQRRRSPGPTTTEEIPISRDSSVRASSCLPHKTHRSAPPLRYANHSHGNCDGC